jgi:hypothetical protein
MNPEAVSLVFTGHMTDTPDRQPPRFPPELEDAARRAIAQRVGRYCRLRNGADIRGFASLARGGDILFHEVCRSLGIDTVIVLPFAPDRFVKISVEGSEAGDWARRFEKLWNETDPGFRYDLGLVPCDDAFAICNDRLLSLAQQYGEVRLIALWDGTGGDRRGGTGDFIERVAGIASPPDIIHPQDLL